MKITNHKSSGFTLVEMVIATGIVILVLVSLTRAVSFALSNTRFSQEKTQSVRLSQEAIEWLRSHRDTYGWRAFFQAIKDDNSEQVIYCLPELVQGRNAFINLSNQSSDTCPMVADTSFSRTLNITIVDESQLDIESLVTWGDGDRTYQTLLTTSLHEWR